MDAYSTSDSQAQTLRKLSQAGRVADEYGFLVQPGSIKKPNASRIALNKKQEVEFVKFLQNPQPWSQMRDSAQYKKIKKLCRSGIPESLRAQAWTKFAGCEKFQKAGLYQELLTREHVSIFDVIERDINRCFPDHEMFTDPAGDGQRNLRNVLRAYAVYNPEVEYCQGMGFLAGMMLMHMQAEDSFWLLVATIENYAKGFFNASLSQIRIDAEVFKQLLKQKSRVLSRKMVLLITTYPLSQEDLDISPLLYITQWFITFFTGPLPWESVLRVWDMFYYDGIKAFFRVALGILKLCQDQIMECPGTTELLDFILHIPHKYLGPEDLVKRSLRVKLTHEQIDRLRYRVAARMEKDRIY